MHGHPFAIENVEKARSMFYRYSSRFLTTFFFVFGLTMWSWPLFAQGPAEAEDLQLMKVQGQVYDAETLQPLAGTNVILVKNSVKANQFGVATAKNGTFIFLRVEPGSYKLTIRRIGYEDQIFKNMQVGSAATPKFLRIPLKPTAINADEVIITATRREQTAQMAPASVAIVSTSQLRNSPVRTFDQVLESVPGISIYRSSDVSVQSLSIRGSSDVAGGGVGNRVLLTIDGRPALTADTGGALWSLVPLGYIEQVEVVKGAFSSLYGSTAMGGVVNVITRRPAYRALTTVETGFGLYEQTHPALRFSEQTSYRNELTVRHSGNRGRVSYLLDLSRKQSDGHSENAGSRFFNAFGKLMYDLRKNRNLEISLGTTTSDNDFPHTWLSALQPLRVDPGDRDDRQQKRAYSADFHYWALANANIKYSSRFYFYRNSSRSFYNENDPNWLSTGNQPFGQQTWVDADKYGNLSQIDVILNDDHNLIGGLDFQLDRVDSAPDTIMYGKRQVNNIAGYLQHEWQVSPQWTLTSGLRYDWNHLVNGQNLSQLSPKLAAVYHPNSRLAIRTLFGQAFRAPSIAERFFQREVNGGTLFKPNPELQAEKMDFSLESGFRLQATDQLSFDFSYFRYHYRDMIYWQEISEEEGVIYTLFQVRNLNRALLQGLEATVDYRWSRHLHAAATYTLTDAKDQSPNRADDILPYRARHALFLSLNATYNRFNLHVNSRYQSQIDEVFLYPLDAPDAFFVSNAKLGVRLTKPVQASLAVNNIFDSQYEELARYRMPGRNWFFGLEYQF